MTSFLFVRYILMLSRLSTDTIEVKYLPSWVPFQRKALECRAIIERAVAAPFEDAKAEIVSKSPAPRCCIQTRLKLSVESWNSRSILDARSLDDETSSWN